MSRPPAALQGSKENRRRDFSVCLVAARFLGGGYFRPGAEGLASANALQPEVLVVPWARELRWAAQGRALGSDAAPSPPARPPARGEGGCRQVHRVAYACARGRLPGEAVGRALPDGRARSICCRRSVRTARAAARERAPRSGGHSPRGEGARCRRAAAAPQRLTSSCLAGEGDGPESAAVAASEVSETVI